ncbi:hypothetical protein RhiirA5_431800 [Rhizophagus irregularis]|uniref:Uncharacterized protein n=2 Tax=Rhizophagus irregularis TaxID=588596 RepID=A0A2N0NUF8_9GLOM|nr:hypothetical protein RhiirA5_431800 [Rhizophagus irregularis]
MLTSEQDEQDLSQSYEASSESIRSASCVLSKQPQVNASKLTCNLENREDSSRSELCDMEKLKSDLHNEVIAKLDKNIIVEQELKQQLSSPAHTSTSDQTLEEQDPSSDTAQNIVCMFRKANKLDHVSSVISSHNETVHDHSHVTSKINPANAYIPPKAKVSTSENVLSASQSNSTYDRTYFCNKALDQYPNLYREFSSENFDYYGITDETPCPLCKLDHDDEDGIEEVHKSEVINSIPENKASSFPEQCEEEVPITFKAKPDQELIINRETRHALFVMENMGIMDYMANGMEQNIVLLASLQTTNSNSKMVRKKNKRHNQSRQSATSSSANETQSKNMIVSDMELRELVRQGEGKKGWLSRGSVATLHKATTTERVVDLLNDAKNKGPEARGQIIIF